MSEDQDLEAKIAALSGRINEHKQRGTLQPYRVHKPWSNDYEYHGPGRGHSAWTPYAAPSRGRGRGRGRGATTYRNKSLVMTGTANAVGSDRQPPTPSTPYSVDARDSPTWVSKTDTGFKQLINSTIYDKISQDKTRAIAETRAQKAQERDKYERAKVQTYFNPSSRTNQSGFAPEQPMSHSITINNVSFQVADGGSKLIRKPSTSTRLPRARAQPLNEADDFTRSTPTPKQTTIGGVKFLRSRNGNLYRAGLVKAAKSGPPWNCNGPTDHLYRQGPVRKTTSLCPQFTASGTPTPIPRNNPLWRPCRLRKKGLWSRSLLTYTAGQCPKGPKCRHQHDPDKVAICMDYLKTGKCPMGDACDLSHDCTPHRVPTCLHFLRGHCTNDNCRYAHVRVNPSAPVCRAFARLGYCDKSAACADRHVTECPDYANKQMCRRENCRLPHVDRAGQIRKNTAAAAAAQTESEGSPDLSSDEEEYDSDGFDSDGIEEFLGGGRQGGGASELTQQQDFVELS